MLTLGEMDVHTGSGFKEHGSAAAEHQSASHTKSAANGSKAALATEAQAPGESSDAGPASKSWPNRANPSPDQKKQPPCKRKGSPRCSAAKQRVLINLACDGYLWLKYGEKQLVEANLIRTYFKCSSFLQTSCDAQKLVDFDPMDPLGKPPVIEYPRAHNHEPPVTDSSTEPQQAGKQGHDETPQNAQQRHPRLHTVSVSLVRGIGSGSGGEYAALDAGAPGSASTRTATAQNPSEMATPRSGSAVAAEQQTRDMPKGSREEVEMETLVSHGAEQLGAPSGGAASCPDDVLCPDGVSMWAARSPSEPNISNDIQALLDDICNLVGPIGGEARPPVPHSQACSACGTQEGGVNGSSCPEQPLLAPENLSFGMVWDTEWCIWPPEGPLSEPDDLQSIMEHHAPGILCSTGPLHTEPGSTSVPIVSATHKRGVPEWAPLSPSKKSSPCSPKPRKKSETSLHGVTDGSMERSCIDRNCQVKQAGTADLSNSKLECQLQGILWEYLKRKRQRCGLKV